MKLKIITRSEFDRLDTSHRIIVNDNSHQYAVLDLSNTLGYYGLAWRSHHIEPIIQLSEDEKPFG